METTERIVESYVRYIRGWATIPNIKCKGQYEIDLLAIDPVTLQRYHIESGVSISGSHSRLTARPFDPEALKRRVEAATQRRTLGYFGERKFGAPEVVARLADYGFHEGNYKKVIVSWGWTDDAAQEAEELRIVLWDFRDILQAIAQEVGRGKAYYTDDTLRTLQLFYKAGRWQQPESRESLEQIGVEVMRSVKLLRKKVTRQDVLDALNQFDSEYPDTNDYDSWLDKGNYKYALQHSGRLYPCKYILSLASGFDRREFGGGEQTNSVFRRLGFEVIDKP